MSETQPHSPNQHPAALLWKLISPDKQFYFVATIYSIAISFLALSVPIAVQTLINSLINVASIKTIIVLSSVLFLALLTSGALSAMRTRTLEYFERRIYARLTAEVCLHTIYAQHDFFAGRRNTDITNRYFDIVILQKNIPMILVDGFALILQMIVSFTLVSLYHPILLLYNIILVLTIYAIWKIWGKSATQTAINLSHAKYEASKWLDSLAYAHEFFKSTSHINYAIQQTDKLTQDYVTHHRNHFKYTFAQTIAFLLLYAAASAGLLGTGGILVVWGQLSLGQLVAAELILAAILFGLAKAADYLKLYYQMCGAADELNLVLKVPQENSNQASKMSLNGNALTFKQVKVEDCLFNFHVPDNAKVLVESHDVKLQQIIIYLLKRNIRPKTGSVELANFDLEDFNLYHLRQEIAVIDRAPIVECSILEFLRLSSSASLAAINSVLTQVDILNEIEQLPEGLSTELSPLGNPLSPAAFLQLKLAATLLSQPKIVVISPFFDQQPQETIDQIAASLAHLPITVLYFTQLKHQPCFSHRLTLDKHHQTISEVPHSQ